MRTVERYDESLQFSLMLTRRDAQRLLRRTPVDPGILLKIGSGLARCWPPETW
jgi:hypothetical protein